jgi:hypothetical protein
MNSNPNNLVMKNSTIIKSNNSKSMIMGILLITATTFLVICNTNGTAFAQAGENVGCANAVKVIIAYLPKQTADSSTIVTLFNMGPNDDRGHANINIPGIGSGLLEVYFHNAAYRTYGATFDKFPGQTEYYHIALVSNTDFCYKGGSLRGPLVIPGIGDGDITLTRVN